MKRISTGLSLAAAIGLAATLSAQTTSTTARPMTSDKDHEVSVTGCLSKAAGGYMLNNARVDSGTSSSTTTASGGTSTTAGSSTTGGSSTTTAGTTRTNPEAGAVGTAGAAMSWMLTGNDDLQKHVGHKIQVTGKTTWDSSMDHNRTSASTSTTATSSTTTSTNSGSEPRLDVKSIKMISSSCS
jgi:hypothetical protein